MIPTCFIYRRYKNLHKRCSDKTSSHEVLLEKDGSISVHYKNIQTLAVEMFKMKNSMSPGIVSDIFFALNGKS